jgi:hypothetical protein
VVEEFSGWMDGRITLICLVEGWVPKEGLKRDEIKAMMSLVSFGP